MLQETVLRVDGIDNLKAPIGVCNKEHRFMLREQLKEINIAPLTIILEPIGKNTAVALAALEANPEDVLLVLPADHAIANVHSFQTAIKRARFIAEQGYLVTFGITPTSPETGYGYIKGGNNVLNHALNVDAFIEKPNLDKAKHYVASADYFWNSGMFVFKAGSYLEELQKFNPDILESCKKASKAAAMDADFKFIDKTIFAQCPANSIDFAVLEKTNKAVVVPLDARWNDVGSWSVLWDVGTKDANSNVLNGY